MLRTRYGATLFAIVRQRGADFRVVPAMAESVMRRGDLLAVSGDAKALDRFRTAEHLDEQPFDDRIRSAARQELGVAEVMLAPDSPLIGKTLRDAQFRKRRGLTVLAIKRRGQLVEGNLIDTPLNFGDLMLVAGAWPLIARLREEPGEFVVLRLPNELLTVVPARKKAPLALGILVVMTAVMTFGLLPNVIAVLLGCAGGGRHRLHRGQVGLPHRRLVDAGADRRHAAAGDGVGEDRRDRRRWRSA